MRAGDRRTISRWIADRTCLSIHPSRRDVRGFPALEPTLVGAVSSGLFANADRNQRYTTRERYDAPTGLEVPLLARNARRYYNFG